MGMYTTEARANGVRFPAGPFIFLIITFIKPISLFMSMAKEVSTTNNSGVFALTSAVLSIVLPISAMPFGFIGGVIFAVLGLVFGIRQTIYSKNSWATAAIIFSVIGLLLNAFVVYQLIILVNYVQSYVSQYSSQLAQASNLAQQVQGAAAQYAK